ncbi:unnamed protein product [Euphydryas editha]|uniref:Reverse transcriptase n=1 Tax=Euphydryas editha TaxID=104508 RepID=A0AAU9TSW5_EUPED|nr:unnamed protein product [Euphydryas editha]
MDETGIQTSSNKPPRVLTKNAPDLPGGRVSHGWSYGRRYAGGTIRAKAHQPTAHRPNRAKGKGAPPALLSRKQRDRAVVFTLKAARQTFNEDEVNITLADGVSRRQKVLFFSANVEDAIQSMDSAEVELSPHARSLFDDDVGLMAIDVTETILNEEQRQALQALLNEYSDLFTPNKDPVKGVEHCIDTGDHTSIAVPLYRMSPQRKELLKIEVEMLKDGVIVSSTSPWAAPVVMVPKLDGLITED